MHGIEAQQMGVGLDRAEIVDADDFDILAAGFRDRPQDVAADAAKSVDRDPDCHAAVSPSMSWLSAPRRALVIHEGAYGGSPGSAGRERIKMSC